MEMDLEGVKYTRKGLSNPIECRLDHDTEKSWATQTQIAQWLETTQSDQLNREWIRRLRRSGRYRVRLGSKFFGRRSIFQGREKIVCSPSRQIALGNHLANQFQTDHGSRESPGRSHGTTPQQNMYILSHKGYLCGVQKWNRLWDLFQESLDSCIA